MSYPTYSVLLYPSARGLACSIDGIPSTHSIDSFAHSVRVMPRLLLGPQTTIEPVIGRALAYIMFIGSQSIPKSLLFLRLPLYLILKLDVPLPLTNRGRIRISPAKSENYSLLLTLDSRLRRNAAECIIFIVPTRRWAAQGDSILRVNHAVDNIT